MQDVIRKNETEYCGKVPLHQTNLIQPHGYLLVVAKEGLRILQASENAVALLQRPLEEIVASNLHDYLSEEQQTEWKQRFAMPVSERLPFLLDLPAGRFLTTIKEQKNYYIVEIEKDKAPLPGRDSFFSVYQELKFIASAIENARTTLEACEIAARELKRVSRFDKVMIYRFDKDWNGDVIAEVKEEEMESYLGLKFPASDVPRQARELYKKIPFRLIPNVNYEPVKLYPVLNPLSQNFTDLSDSNLRSVAGVHLEYLRNMKVSASMSTRILKNGELWGLIACHHRTPAYLHFELCALFELLSAAISARISTLDSQDSFRYNEELHRLHNTVSEQLYREDALTALDDHLLQLLAADGVAIINKGQIEILGKAPAVFEVEYLLIWLESLEVKELYTHNSLHQVYEPAEAFSDVASGLLVLPVIPEQKIYLLAFRAEAVQKINWGGKPDEALQWEGKKYHPRASFTIWQQQVEKSAAPWTTEELAAAAQFRNTLVRYFFNKS
jgi:two-component system, chemotaxis family, sensor kinase Cph1